MAVALSCDSVSRGRSEQLHFENCKDKHNILKLLENRYFGETPLSSHV